MLCDDATMAVDLFFFFFLSFLLLVSRLTSVLKHEERKRR